MRKRVKPETLEKSVNYMKALFPEATIDFLVKLRHHSTYAIKAIHRLGFNSLDEIKVVPKNEQ